MSARPPGGHPQRPRKAAHHPSPGSGRAVSYSPSYVCLRLRHIRVRLGHTPPAVSTPRLWLIFLLVFSFSVFSILN